jgi:hypothetical protein
MHNFKRIQMIFVQIRIRLFKTAVIMQLKLLGPASKYSMFKLTKKASL